MRNTWYANSALNPPPVPVKVQLTTDSVGHFVGERLSQERIVGGFASV